MEKEDLVSVIIPVYNCSKFITATLNSLQRQTYRNWEAIVVDDKSTDNSLTLIKQFQDSRIKVLELTRNSGVSYARNKGIEKANGKYIAFLDADDIWVPEKLQKQLEFMRKNNIIFSYTKFSYIDEEFTKIKHVAKVPKKMNYKKALKNTAILTSTVMLNVKELNKAVIKMPDLQRGEDTATWWNILRQGTVAYGLLENLTYYRSRKGSTSWNKIQCIKSTWLLYKKYTEFPIWKAIYYYLHYCFNATMRRIV